MKLSEGESSIDVVLEDGVASLGGRAVPFSTRRSGAAIVAIEAGGESFGVRAVREGNRVFVWCAERTFEFRMDPPAGAKRTRVRPSAADSGGLLSPMPGRIRRVLAAVGDAVTRGQVLMVLEAMKMEHSIRSPRDGRLVRLACAEGDLVEAGVALAEIE
ncbi:MAG: acetyl-CoA carboxylase biotin carboxyl carrier protein subunit [Acidobacteriota bacterium]